MLPTINGKPFTECTIDDISAILANQDYRESVLLRSFFAKKAGNSQSVVNIND